MNRDTDHHSPLPFSAETDLEQAVMNDPEWLEGALWGEPRPGHPEGVVAEQVAQVLANIDRCPALDPDNRRRLRFVALIPAIRRGSMSSRWPAAGKATTGVEPVWTALQAAA